MFFFIFFLSIPFQSFALSTFFLLSSSSFNLLSSSICVFLTSLLKFVFYAFLCLLFLLLSFIPSFVFLLFGSSFFISKLALIFHDCPQPPVARDFSMMIQSIGDNRYVNNSPPPPDLPQGCPPPPSPSSGCGSSWSGTLCSSVAWGPPPAWSLALR